MNNTSPVQPVYSGRPDWLGGSTNAGAYPGRGGSDFGSILARPADRAGATPEERARSAAQEFVAVALVQPVLTQLRESSLAAPPFVPTQGERQFQGLYDAEVARRLVSATHFPLVDRLAHDLLKKGHGQDRAEGPVGREVFA